jgi:glycerol kinase
MDKYILALDQGTTSSRSILFNRLGKIMATSQQEFKQIFPQPGWVEHDPVEIWESQISTAKDVIRKAQINTEQIEAIGIANQRETIVAWNKETGMPVYHAIVWQDRRTAPYCEALKKEGFSDPIRDRTGLVIDAYFSGPKIKWILDHVPEAKKLADQGTLMCGTIDSWLLFKLTGNVHATDFSNASRTMLFNIHEKTWDTFLCKRLNIPMHILPEVRDSSGMFGVSDSAVLGKSIPITGIAGDQQAALFGQLCHKPGMAKNTYGTGCFMLMNSGDEPVVSKLGLLTTIAWSINNHVTYALEGSVFIGGAVVQWLRDGLNLIDHASESEKLARSVNDNGGVFMVPAFTGLGTPHWDMYARGAILGITRGTTKAHFVRAALESIAYQSYDVLKTMENESRIQLNTLRVD